MVLKSWCKHTETEQIANIVGDNILKCDFSEVNFGILIKISLNFIHKTPIKHQSTLIQVNAWC